MSLTYPHDGFLDPPAFDDAYWIERGVEAAVPNVHAAIEELREAAQAYESAVGPRERHDEIDSAIRSLVEAFGEPQDEKQFPPLDIRRYSIVEVLQSGRLYRIDRDTRVMATQRGGYLILWQPVPESGNFRARRAAPIGPGIDKAAIFERFLDEIYGPRHEEEPAVDDGRGLRASDAAAEASGL